MKKIIVTLFIIFSFLFTNNIYAKDFNMNNDKVYVSGETVGLKLNTGVLVTKLYSINVNDELIKPWESSDIKVGDIILKVNDINIISSDSLIGALKSNTKEECSIQLLRDDKLISTHIKPMNHDGTISLGIYVKDNILGIGTMTFITQDDLDYASLGHQINTTLKNTSGSIYNANVIGVDKSESGVPGSKKATIDNKVIGDITLNSIKGIYGNYNTIPKNLDLYYVEKKEEVDKGSASILTCIDGKKVCSYKIEIVSLDVNSKDGIKGIKFKVVDEELLELTGGVVQGMSGSPIIQDGKLIGAVTHVIVNTPEYGYGVFAENMLLELDYNLIK